MELRELELGDLRYNPNDKRSLNKLQDEYAEFQEDLGDLEDTRLEVLRYIILVYDMKSPLWDLYRDNIQRMTEALSLAKFETQDNGEFSKHILQGLLYGNNRAVNSMITRYVSLFNNVRFMQLSGLLEVYTKLFLRLRSEKPDKNEVDTFNKTATNIERLTQEVFGGKQNTELENSLYEMLSFNKILFRPEHVAHRKKKGKKLTNAKPYEEKSGKS
jgi:hypothetical protein